jgi:hypothetical protein
MCELAESFFVDSIKPAECEKVKETQYLYSKLGENVIPKSTENKYYNTISFFHHSAKQKYCESMRNVQN